MNNTICNVNTIAKDLGEIRVKAPLVHNITNFVVMNLTANALLAIGASPIMAHAIEEVADIARLSQALVLNIGTLDESWVKSMIEAAKTARKCSIPIILDPVGAGATKFRTDVVAKILASVAPSVLRSNAAEIMALAGATIQSKGVDSQYSTDAATKAAEQLAQQYNCTVVISGETDLIIDNDKKYKINNGSPLMTKITGMGCTATAIIGAFCAVNNNYFQAATHAMAVMGLSGEIAAANASGPGSFQASFLDTLYNMDNKNIKGRLQFEQI